MADDKTEAPIQIRDLLKCSECGGQFSLMAGDVLFLRLADLPEPDAVYAMQQVFRPLVENGCVIVLGLPGWDLEQITEETMALAGWVRMPGSRQDLDLQ